MKYFSILLIAFVTTNLSYAQTDFTIEYVLNNKDNIVPLFGEELDNYFDQRAEGIYRKYDESLYEKGLKSDEKGRNSLKNNNLSEATKHFEDALTLYDRSGIKKEAYPHIRVVLAFVHAVNGDGKSVKKQVKELTTKSLKDPFAMNYLAAAYSMIDEFKDAETYLYESIDFNPEFCTTYDNFIYLYENQLDNKKRVEKFKERKASDCIK